MCELPQSIGREEIIPPPRHPLCSEDHNSVHSINHNTSDARADLQKRIWDQIVAVARALHKYEPFNASGEALYDGWPDPSFVVMWDHWQPCLKEICHGHGVYGQERRDFSQQEVKTLWEDSSEDDI